MNVKSICESYFNGFKELGNFQDNDKAANALAILKIISYFTVFILLGFAVAYGAASLCGRVRKKQDLSPIDHTLSNQAQTILAVKSKDSSQEVPEALPSIPAKILEHLNFGGKKWISNIQLFHYFTCLKANYPELFLHHPKRVYVCKANASKNEKQIEEAILTDGHFVTEECLHPPWANCKEQNILAYPLNVSGNHWTLVVIDRKKRTLEYYDSKKNYGNYSEIVNRLEHFAQFLSAKDPEKSPYTFISKINKTLQLDSYQCGIWVAYFLEARCKNPEVDFNLLDVAEAQEMIAAYREKMMSALFATKSMLSLSPSGDMAISLSNI